MTISPTVTERPYITTGTATLTPRFGGSTTGITTSTASMSWQRVNDFVLFTASIVFTNKGSFTASDTLDIQGLPFNPAENAVVPVRLVNVVAAAGQEHVFVRLGAASDDAFVEQMVSGNPVRLDWADFANNSQIQFSGSYRV